MFKKPNNICNMQEKVVVGCLVVGMVEKALQILQNEEISLLYLK